MKQEVITRVTDKDPNSFSAVAELRKQLKSFDPYLIYKLNDGTLNDEISFVFKSSRCAAQLALEMDYQDPENRSCLREEPVYCDTMHSRVENYKNITAWVKNPITRSVMRIATMEAMHEDTPTMILFFNLLNEVLQKVSGKPKYKFNPSRFYVDEGGANKNAIFQSIWASCTEQDCNLSMALLAMCPHKSNGGERTPQEDFWQAM